MGWDISSEPDVSLKVAPRLKLKLRKTLFSDLIHSDREWPTVTGLAAPYNEKSEVKGDFSHYRGVMRLKLLLGRAPTMIKPAWQRALPTKNYLDARTASTTARPQGIVCCRSLEEDRDSKSICNGAHKNVTKSSKKDLATFLCLFAVILIPQCCIFPVRSSSAS